MQLTAPPQSAWLLRNSQLMMEGDDPPSQKIAPPLTGICPLMIAIPCTCVSALSPEWK